MLPRMGEGAKEKLENTNQVFDKNTEDYLIYMLRKRERFGLPIKKEDFKRLLEADFQQLLKDNPPIPGEFCPERYLRSIRNLPRGQKREALKIFKENLARQRIALAACRFFIERSIRVNPDISKDEMMKLVRRFAEQYGFDDRHMQIAEQLIDKYLEQRQRILNFCEKYPDNVSLVSALTGIAFDENAKLEVSIGPMSVNIFLDDSDYERVYSLWFNNANFPIHPAFAVRFLKKNTQIPFTVINRETSFFYRNNNLFHEEQHHINAIFQYVLHHPSIKQMHRGLLYQQYQFAEDPELKRELLIDFLLFEREQAFVSVKDEIFAMKKDGFAYENYSVYFFQENSLYDYLAYLRKWVDELVEVKNDPRLQEMVEQILVREYRKIIEDAIAAFCELEKRYTINEIIALLTDKPLSEWPKTTRRLLEQDKKK